MPLRTFLLLGAAAAALAAASGCGDPPSSGNEPTPVVHTQLRVGVKAKPGARKAARPKKSPMQTGPTQSATVNDL